MSGGMALPLAAELSDWTRFGLVLGGGLVAGIVLYQVAMAIGGRGDSDPRGAQALGRILRVLAIAVAVIYALPQVGVRIGPLLTAAGIAGVALAFAVRTIFENFLAGVLLLLRRPFRPGDQICSNDHEGVVQDVNLRAVVIRTFSGEQVFIPNGEVLGNPIVNRTAFSARRSELAVGVAYESDLERASRVMVEAMRGVEGVHAEPPPEALAHQVADSAINFCVRFWHGPREHEMWEVRHRVTVAITRALAEAEIEIPFPQLSLRSR